MTAIGWGVLSAAVATGSLAYLTGNGYLRAAAAIAASTFVVARALAPRDPAISVALIGPAQAVVGETFSATLRVSNHSRRSSPLAQLRWTSRLTTSATQRLGRLGPGEGADLALRLSVRQRGVDHGTSCSLELSDPFGLFRRELTVTATGTVVAFPALRPVTLPRSQAQAPDRRSTRAARGREFASPRPWRTGDDRRQINWRASARAAHLIVMEPERVQRRAVCVAVADTAERDLDDAVALAASAICAGLRSGHRMAVLDRSLARPITIRTRTQALHWAAGFELAHALRPVDVRAAVRAEREQCREFWLASDMPAIGAGAQVHLLAP